MQVVLPCRPDLVLSPKAIPVVAALAVTGKGWHRDFWSAAGNWSCSAPAPTHPLPKAHGDGTHPMEMGFTPWRQDSLHGEETHLG